MSFARAEQSAALGARAARPTEAATSGKGAASAMAVSATASGRRQQQEERPPLGGIDHMIAESRRSELVMGKLRKRLADLGGEVQRALVAEQRAVEAEEQARVAVEERVPDDGEGEETQEALYLAMDGTSRAAENLAVLMAKEKAARAELTRAEEEYKRVGEDTRLSADKRKRREEKGSDRGEGDGRKKVGEGQEGQRVA